MDVYVNPHHIHTLQGSCFSQMPEKAVFVALNGGYSQKRKPYTKRGSRQTHRSKTDRKANKLHKPYKATKRSRSKRLRRKSKTSRRRSK